MFKYGRMQKIISSWLIVCGSRGACLDCIMQCCLGFKSPLGWDFCVQVIYVRVKIVTPCFNWLSLLSSSLVGYDNVLDYGLHKHFLASIEHHYL